MCLQHNTIFIIQNSKIPNKSQRELFEILNKFAFRVNLCTRVVACKLPSARHRLIDFLPCLPWSCCLRTTFFSRFHHYINSNDLSLIVLQMSSCYQKIFYTISLQNIVYFSSLFSPLTFILSNTRLSADYATHYTCAFYNNVFFFVCVILLCGDKAIILRRRSAMKNRLFCDIALRWKSNRSGMSPRRQKRRLASCVSFFFPFRFLHNIS